MAAAPGDSARIHYLDNLRALAMLLGVYLHGALAYAEPSRSVWIATNPQGSVAIDASIWWIHLFRMGLFFLLSGYFAKLVIQRKGLRTVPVESRDSNRFAIRLVLAVADGGHDHCIRLCLFLRQGTSRTDAS